MELVLAHQTEANINVTCNGQYSHTFDLQPLIFPNGRQEELLFHDPRSYGQALYNALFASGTTARQVLDARPERIVLVAVDNDLDAITHMFCLFTLVDSGEQVSNKHCGGIFPKRSCDQTSNES